jgi:hypothetical protein
MSPIPQDTKTGEQRGTTRSPVKSVTCPLWKNEEDEKKNAGMTSTHTEISNCPGFRKGHKNPYYLY